MILVFFFSKVRTTLESYVLPSAYQLLGEPPSKEQWKNIIKTKIHQKINRNKPSLKYINPDLVRAGKVHQIYSFLRNNTFDVRRTEVKAKLLILFANCLAIFSLGGHAVL